MSLQKQVTPGDTLKLEVEITKCVGQSVKVTQKLPSMVK